MREMPGNKAPRDLTKKELSELPKFYSKNFLLNKEVLSLRMEKDKMWKENNSFINFIKKGNFNVIVSRESILLKEHYDRWLTISNSGKSPDYSMNPKVLKPEHITKDFNYTIITESVDGNYFVKSVAGSKLLKLSNIMQQYFQKVEKRNQ